VRKLTVSEDELELLLEVLDTACEAVASDFDLLDAEGAAPAEDEEVELDEGQVQALEWLQRVLGLRERLESQSILGAK